MSGIGALLLAAVVPFAVPSQADQVTIYGQIDKPLVTSRAMVVLVQGTGPHTRHNPTSPLAAPVPYYWWDDLAERFAAVGISTARFDKRGTSCTKPGAPPPRRRLCYDEAESLSAGPETYMGDIEAVVRRAVAEPEARCLIVIGHSEGGWQIAKLIERRRIDPRAFLSLASPMESFAEEMNFQDAGSMVAAIRSVDQNGDGVTSLAEMRAGIGESMIGGSVGADGRWTPGFDNLELGPIPTPQEGWTSVALRELYRKRYAAFEEWRTRLFSRALTEPSKSGRFVMGNTAWQQSLQRDWVPVAYRLRDYRGQLIVHSGTRDALIDPEAGRLALIRFGPPSADYVTHPGLNHMFGATGFRGPADPLFVERVVSDVERVAAGCALPFRPKEKVGAVKAMSGKVALR